MFGPARPADRPRRRPAPTRRLRRYTRKAAAASGGRRPVVVALGAAGLLAGVLGVPLAAATPPAVGTTPPPTIPRASAVNRSLGIGGPYSAAAGINDRGQIAGNGTANRPFGWADGVCHRPGQRARGVLVGGSHGDQHGVVVGNGSQGPSDAWRWERGKVTPIVAPPKTIIDVTGINDRNEICGNANGAAEQRAVVWRGRAATSLGALAGGSSAADAINNRGQVAGWSRLPSGSDHAVLWSAGHPADLTLGGGNSRALGLNDRGDVVGTSETRAGEWHPFLWSHGRMRDLGGLGPRVGEASGINNRGQVVGSSQLASGDIHAFLYSDGRLSDLGTLPGERLSAAAGINDHGQIAGMSAEMRGSHAIWEAVTWTITAPDRAGGAGSQQRAAGSP